MDKQQRKPTMSEIHRWAREQSYLPPVHNIIVARTETMKDHRNSRKRDEPQR